MSELNPGFHQLWPTPIGIYRFDQADAINPVVVEEFTKIREEQESARGTEPGGSFFASDDDLLKVAKFEGWNSLLQFIVNGIAQTAEAANTPFWAGRVQELNISLEGLWFQIAAAGAAHDVHTHGNCSWSGVYIVQIDEPQQRRSHPVYGDANGVTRLYGPHFTSLGGAFIDVGNAYLQQPHLDVDQMEGQLLVFPSWLMHQAMAYGGDKDRVIISFNASVHSSAPSDQMYDYSPY